MEKKTVICVSGISDAQTIKDLTQAIAQMKQSLFTFDVLEELEEVNGKISDCMKHLRMIDPSILVNMNIEFECYDHLEIEDTFSPTVQLHHNSQTSSHAHRKLRLSANRGRHWDRKLR